METIMIKENEKNGRKESKMIVKSAVFGCGKMGRHHMKAIQLQEHVKLVAVADPMADQASLKTILPKETKIFTNSKDLLTTVKPDVVHIVTPPNTHMSLAKEALSHGANVYVEKPFSDNKDEAKKIIAMAEEMDLKVCPGHQLLFERTYEKTLKAIKEIGNIIHVESYFSFRTVRKSISPVDQLLDILPHPLYLLLDLLKKGNEAKGGKKAKIKAIDIKASGEVRGLIQMKDITGVLIVSLNGRPVESYLRVVGTNGSVYADFVRGPVITLPGPGAAAVSVVLNPYKQAKQMMAKTTMELARLLLSKQKSYPGLSELTGAFYESIRNSKPSPISPISIIEMVDLFETIEKELRIEEKIFEQASEKLLREKEKELIPLDKKKGKILVTGGNGFLGRVLVNELRNQAFPVRVISRRMPSFSVRVPGVEYVVADLGEKIEIDLLKGVDTVVHCAAETAGQKQDHERNTIQATSNIIEAAYKSGIKKFIQISSIAVLKPSTKMGKPLEENSEVDMDNIGRGPYVWAKAESERLASKLGKKYNIGIKIIRLGPLVDYQNFQAPGRLGRELGSRFVAIGWKNHDLSLCEVHTAAKVIQYYITNFGKSPSLLNLVEPNAPKRGELIKRLLAERSDLKVFWFPMVFVKVLSPALKVIQRIVFRGKKPIDIYSAFSNERYNSGLADSVLKKINHRN